MTPEKSVRSLFVCVVNHKKQAQSHIKMDRIARKLYQNRFCGRAQQIDLKSKGRFYSNIFFIVVTLSAVSFDDFFLLETFLCVAKIFVYNCCVHSIFC